MSNRIEGRVKWFNNEKGYGFIIPSQGAGIAVDVFVHYSAIDKTGYRSLKDGDHVEFIPVKTPKGYHAQELIVLEGA